jgi:hypothetical protein
VLPAHPASEIRLTCASALSLDAVRSNCDPVVAGPGGDPDARALLIAAGPTGGRQSAWAPADKMAAMDVSAIAESRCCRPAPERRTVTVQVEW